MRTASNVRLSGIKIMSDEQVTANVVQRMKSILAFHDIELQIGGCGCCGSPWVTFKYKGEYIVKDADFFTFDNLREEK